MSKGKGYFEYPTIEELRKVLVERYNNEDIDKIADSELEMCLLSVLTKGSKVFDNKKTYFKGGQMIEILVNTEDRVETAKKRLQAKLEARKSKEKTEL